MNRVVGPCYLQHKLTGIPNSSDSIDSRASVSVVESCQSSLLLDLLRLSIWSELGLCALVDQQTQPIIQLQSWLR